MAWIPCARKPERGHTFCKQHSLAIVGAWLGALVHAQPVDEVEHLCAATSACPLRQREGKK